MVPMWRRAAGIVVLMLLVVPASALASSQASATHAAIAADYALSRVRVGIISSTQAKVEKYNGRLAGECPNAGAGTPENEAAEPMAGEVADALWSIDYGATAGPIQRFASAIKPLRWSSGRFNHAIHMLASSLTGLSKLSLPDLCGDVRSWTASGFQTVPRTWWNSTSEWKPCSSRKCRGSRSPATCTARKPASCPTSNTLN